MNQPCESRLNDRIALLLKQLPGSDEFMSELESVRQIASTEDPEELLALAMVYRMFPKLPAAARHCLELLKSSARLGHPLAVERLADLYSIGWGVDRDTQKVLDLYRQLAGYLIPQVVRELAWMELFSRQDDADQLAGIRHLIEAVLIGDEVAKAWLTTLIGRSDFNDESAAHIRQKLMSVQHASSLDTLELSEQAQQIRDRLHLLRDPGNDKRTDMLSSIVDSLRLGTEEVVTLIERKNMTSSQILSWMPRQVLVRSCLIDLQLDYLDHLKHLYHEQHQFDSGSAHVSLQDQGPVMRSILDSVSVYCQLATDHMERPVFSTILSTNSFEQTGTLSSSRIRDLSLALDDSGQRLMMAIIALDSLNVMASDDSILVRMERGDLLLHHLTRPDGLPDPQATLRLRSTGSSEESTILQIGFRQYSRLHPVIESI